MKTGSISDAWRFLIRNATRLGQHRDLLVIGSGRIVQILVQMAFIRVLTSLLPITEVGRYYLIMTLVSGVQLMMLTPAIQYFERRFLDWQRNGSVCWFLLLLIPFSIIAMLINGLVFFACVRAGMLDLSHYGYLMLAPSLYLGSSSGVGIITSLLNLLQKRTLAVIVPVASMCLGLSLSAVLAFSMKPDAVYWILGLSLAQILVFVIGGLFLAREIASRGNPGPSFVGWMSRLRWESGARPLAFIWPVVLINFLYWSQSQAYRLILAARIDEATVGFFQVSYTMAASMMLAFESVVQMWFVPYFYRDCLGKNADEISVLWQRKYVSVLLALFFPVMCFVTFAGPFVLYFLAAPAFRGGYPYAILAGVAESIRVSGALFYTCAVAQERTRLNLLPVILQALIAVSLVWFLSPSIGLYGVSLALILSYLASLLWWWLIHPGYRNKLIFTSLRKVLPWGGAITLVLFGGLVLWGNGGLLTNLGVLGVGALLVVTALWHAMKAVLKESWSKDSSFRHA